MNNWEINTSVKLYNKMGFLDIYIKGVIYLGQGTFTRDLVNRVKCKYDKGTRTTQNTLHI